MQTGQISGGLVLAVVGDALVGGVEVTILCRASAGSWVTFGDGRGFRLGEARHVRGLAEGEGDGGGYRLEMFYMSE